jgi:hypothetical protein
LDLDRQRAAEEAVSLAKPDTLAGYKPLDWSGPSELSKHDQEMVEIMRKDLWRNGVRTEPNLTRMAYEFAAVACMGKGAP